MTLIKNPDPTQPAYPPYGRYLKFTLDGKPIEYVHAFSEEEGWVDLLEKSPDGGWKMERHGTLRYRPVITRKTGKVVCDTSQVPDKYRHFLPA